MTHYFYRAFGLKFVSEFKITELTPENLSDPEVQIKLGKNPLHLPVIKRKGVLFEVSQSDFLFRFQTVGSFRVQNGNLITIDPDPQAAISDISLFLLGSIMGAILHQRGIIPLHGSSVTINDRAITIIGKSSSGKSTVAAGFAKKGFSILADDISVLDSSNLGFYIQPGLPYLKLWEDVLKHTDSTEGLRRVRPTLNKYIKPLEQAFCRKPIELTSIICLEPCNSRTISHRLITGAEKFNLLRRNTYRYQYLYGNSNFQNYFKQLTKLSEQIKLHTLIRPDSQVEGMDIVEYIINQIEKIK